MALSDEIKWAEDYRIVDKRGTPERRTAILEVVKAKGFIKNIRQILCENFTSGKLCGDCLSCRVINDKAGPKLI